ncbi:MAG: nucleotidyl transferase AbiEii/AbiGii toxin family protein [Candidatus Electrothrix scaldis]|nr:MAG: nucleotidyl transferase AbiEii/AbiGii toxin family protein [Candidatus Electrothrix sp. GW3-3]
MLYFNTVEPETLKLLRRIQAHEECRHFSLAGGTALSLHLGHRISVDLDLFTQDQFDSNALFESLRNSDAFQDAVSSSSQTANSLSLFIKTGGPEVKVDCIRHHYPLLMPIQCVDDIRIFSVQDIAAMKLNAIANRGCKKDFFDVHSLLERFSLPELLSFFEKKYAQVNSFTVLKSLTYFDDAELDPEPMSLVGTDWHEVKSRLYSLVKNHL